MRSCPLGEKAVEQFKKQVKRRTEKLISDLEKEQSPHHEGMKNLIQLMKCSEEDETVKNRLNELVAGDPSAVIAYGKELGYDFTEKDLDQLGKALLEQEEELSDEELEQVAGGIVDLVSLGLVGAGLVGVAGLAVGTGVAVGGLGVVAGVGLGAGGLVVALVAGKVVR